MQQFLIIKHIDVEVSYVQLSQILWNIYHDLVVHIPGNWSTANNFIINNNFLINKIIIIKY